MNKSILAGASTLCVCILAGCGSVSRVDTAQGQPVLNAEVPIVFFQSVSTPKVKVVLHPDPFVMREMPNITPARRQVVVYLPIYPGSTSTSPVAGIGDMGTPMNGDLVDGTVYLKSKDSWAQIKAWYTQQFQKLGYHSTGQGTLADHGKTTSVYDDFIKNGLPGNLTRNPDVNLGFLSHSQGGETVFKLKASYIVTPPRPKDSCLPAGIIKVVLTNGKITKTVTDKKWIADVVQMINTLQVSTPRIGGGFAMKGVPITIHAAFYEINNSVINVTYSIHPATITVGESDVALDSRLSPELNRDLGSVFGD